MYRVAVVYLMWPHYRKAVVAALDHSSQVEYSFYGSGENYLGIPHADASSFKRFVPIGFRTLFGRLWQGDAVGLAYHKKYDALIYLADPNMLSTWIAAMIARVRGVPVLFWGHGWRRREPTAKRLMRNLFFNRADRLLVYAERAKQLGIASGFPVDRIVPVYNSLDVDQADVIIARIEDGSLTSIAPSAFFAHPERPLVICTARLNANCDFPLLFSAARLLEQRGRPINILLVGDGPERTALEAMAHELDLAAHFYGACYDEEAVGQMIYHADITVSPGKIGLTAMHSLMYGTPAITHDNLDTQMPEVEAIQHGETGLLFREHDAQDLADKIAQWIDGQRDRAAVRMAARRVIREKWNGDVQARIIDEAVIGAIMARRSRP